MKNLLVTRAIKEYIQERHGLKSAGDVVEKMEEDFLVYLDRACERTKENKARIVLIKYL